MAKNKKNKIDINEKEIKEEVIVEETKNEEVKRSFFKDTFVSNLIFVTLIVFLIEILFRAISDFELLSVSSLRIFLSSFILTFIITFLSSLTKRKWLKNTINLVYIFAYSIYTWLQLGFINYLGVYISFNTSSQLGAVTDYALDYLLSFKLVFYVIFLPFIAAIIWYLVLNRKRKWNKLKLNIKHLYLIPILTVSIVLYYLTIILPFMQNSFQIKSNEKLFKNPDVPTVAVNQFGTTVFGILDFKTFLFPVDEESLEYVSNGNEEEEIVSREVSEALDEIAEAETNKKYTSLNNYFASQKVTDYNDYTGMFEGKNVVVVLMESVNEGIINEEFFPNFYKLYSEGWHWENNYSPRNSCATGNNEFSAMTGLYSIYNTCTTNVYKNNTYFESIFGLFNDKGYTTTSMHNFVEWYYYRKTIHPNMGSGKYYGAGDLKIKTAGYYGEWPSDVEFFEKAFDIVLNDESDKPWMTWLTTVTSHQPYSSSSTYGDLYKNDFKKLGYSTAVSRYLSKLKVVDEAIGVMIDKLNEAGELENTVIVMLADHYPYGLSKSYIKEMISHSLSDYDIEKTPLVIYNPAMESKTFTEYSSYINLVPTIANLMGLDYDPRLYMGDDLLSDDYESLVVFADGSWKNEKAYYNASTSKLKYYGEDTYTTEEVQKINSDVSLKISMSSKAIKSNYFNYLEKKIDEYEESQKEDVVVSEETIDLSKKEN
ncbi:MAG: sulfatase-like hydrolase/transferase [Bacilli bacterium]|nr:sulfatase-like hydrolase/transferase [Bacilli bacterium]